MKVDFTRQISRSGTDSIKHDAAKMMGKPEDLIPLWVADMDFMAPNDVLDVMVERVKHGIFGYTDAISNHYFDALHHWMLTHHGYSPKVEWLVMCPSVVNAICTAIRALSTEGDGIIINQPVYHPFAESIVSNHRRCVVSALRYNDGKYTVDFEDFEAKIIAENVKLFILCNPHNPIGRVWTEAELMQLGDICHRHHVKVISDEIHADFVFTAWGHRHVVFSELKPEFQEMTITCTAPSKTFNLAGLQQSNIFIPNDQIRLQFKREVTRMGLGVPNVMGFVACRAAYEHGERWLEALKQQLMENITYVKQYIEDNMPKVKLVEPQATYLLWLDFSELGLTQRELDAFITDEAKLWLNTGTMFGEAGEGFQRMNVACPKKTLEKAMLQLKNAIERFDA